MSRLRRYESSDEDSARWAGFPFREGDIVISTRSKHGTTWLQAICALLVFQTPELPGPLATLSPWLDWLVEPRDEVVSRLEAQTHRRFVKTHTPLDGVPLNRQVTYIVGARHPLDAAVSLHHQADNVDRDRLRALTGQPGRTSSVRPPMHEWLLAWIEGDAAPTEELDSLPGALWHVGDAWARREEPNVVLVHYADLLGDLDTSMRVLAARLDVAVDEARWPELLRAATFREMRARADQLVPDGLGVLKDRAAFFRRGTSGAGRALLTEAEHARYVERASGLASGDLLSWLHR